MFTVTSSELLHPWAIAPAHEDDRFDLPCTIDDERDATEIVSPHIVHLIEEGPRDERHVGGMLRTILPHDKAMLIAHRSVEAFLDEVDELAPGVVIVDSRSVETAGTSLLGYLRTGDFPFAVILLAPRADVALAVRAMKDGAADVMTTPCDPDALMASIDAAFAQVWQRQADQSAVAAARALIEQLSRRERSVLCGLIRGWSNKKMAHDLDLSPRTVEIHRANLMQKLGARHLSEVMRIVYAAGMIDQL
jgi:two-component system response regulator FixJ